MTANSFHPGMVATHSPHLQGGFKLAARLIAPFLATPEEAAPLYVRLALDPALEGVSGRYFDRTGEPPHSPLADDRELAARLWELSARLTGLGRPAQGATSCRIPL